MKLMAQHSPHRPGPSRSGGRIVPSWIASRVAMKILRVLELVAVFFALLQNVSAQGFVNLDFENAGAHVPQTPVNGFGGSLDPALAFPGWTVGSGLVLYNNLTLGSPAVVLIGPRFPNAINYSPLQGSYSVLLEYFGIAGGPPTLSQTGLIPANAQSISFLVPAGANGTYPAATVLTLNGVNIPLFPYAGGRVAGNVSGFAGNIAQLTFSTLNSTDWLYLDDIRFSAFPVPEPRLSTLFCICFGFMFWRMNRRSKLGI